MSERRPKSSERTAALAAFVSIVLMVGCSSPPTEPVEPPFEAEYSTPYLEISTDFTAELCAGSIALMDAQFRWMEEEFAGPQDDPVWVYLYPDVKTVEDCPQPKGGNAGGCWDVPVVYSTWGGVSHELTHAYMWSINDHALTVLQEGFAVALAGGVQVSCPECREDFGMWLLGPITPSSASYQAAGHFVRWLMTEFGMATAVEIYARARPGMSDAEMSMVLQDVIGAGLDEVLNAYTSSANDYYPGLGPFACGHGEPVEWDGENAAWEGEISASDGFSIGQYSQDGSFGMWRRWRLEVPETGFYDVEVPGGEPGFTRCMTNAVDIGQLAAPSSEPVIDEWSYLEPLHHPPGRETTWDYADPILLYAGTYEFWVGKDGADTRPGFSVSIQRQ